MTAVLFSLTMLLFIIKRLEGNIFLNFYLDGAAGIIGTFIGQPIYRCLKIRYSMMLGFFFVVLFSVVLLLFHDYNIPNQWVEGATGQPLSPYARDSPEDNEYHLRVIVPSLVFVIKVSLNWILLTLNQAIYREPVIFPFYKRATSIGICTFIAKIISILAPVAAELPRPWTDVILIILNSIALFTCLILPCPIDQKEYDERTERKKEATIQDKENRMSALAMDKKEE